jgi:hypothetical protein
MMLMMMVITMMMLMLMLMMMMSMSMMMMVVVMMMTMMMMMMGTMMGTGDDDDVHELTSAAQSLESTPLFMTDGHPSAADVAKSPALSGIQAMLNEDLTPVERAEVYKDSGNDAFKTGTPDGFRKAVGLYTEALRLPLDSRCLQATLVGNRAMAHLALGVCSERKFPL